jgi:hypothetical protein
MFKQMLMRLFPKWFGPKCYRLAPSRYALLELFGHVALGPCWVTETERYGKKFCLACKLKPDGTTELPMLLGPGAIFRETEITRDEAMDRARPEWTPYRKQDDEPVCDLCNESERDCTCPAPEPVKEPETLPIPFDAIEAILDHLGTGESSGLAVHVHILRAWHEQEQSDIPF